MNLYCGPAAGAGGSIFANEFDWLNGTGNVFGLTIDKLSGVYFNCCLVEAGDNTVDSSPEGGDGCVWSLYSWRDRWTRQVTIVQDWTGSCGGGINLGLAT